MLAKMTFPARHRAKLLSTNPIERLNGEIKRRTEAIGIFPKREESPGVWSERWGPDSKTRK